MNFAGVSGAQIATTTNFYKYNGKELQGDHKLKWYDYGARFYDATIGRFHTQDRFAEKYNCLTPYHYVANNPILNIDIQGDSLVAVHMKGLTSNDAVLKTRTYYVYSKVAKNIVGFVRDARAKFKNLSVNNTFRTESSANINTKNSKAKGLSRHQAGFAIDLNGVSTLSDNERNELNEIATKYGLSPLANQKKDPPHFSSNPTDHGYENLEDAVNENSNHYTDLTSGVKTSAVKNKAGEITGVKYTREGSNASQFNALINTLLGQLNK